MTQVYSDLTSEHFDLTGFFYNPNIYPHEEYEKRRLSMERYSSIIGLPMYYMENDLEHKAGDCPICYETRLLRTAQFAKSNGFDSFTTTLLISPFQNHDLIKKIGFKIEEDEGIVFLYRDFRPHYNKGRVLAKEFKLYMQKYCGCSSSAAFKEAKK